ncbi:hypothetical protein ACIRPH_19075 [Nocardiopsis sp. NPDC101807]|uniref:hypothetical protein n=1 Tax=Nocardiopsis sp. NPDC101807 TaxID=3364339 RepID=UPI003810140A
MQARCDHSHATIHEVRDVTDIEPTGTAAGARGASPGARRRAEPRPGPHRNGPLLAVRAAAGAVTVLAAAEIAAGLAGFPVQGLTSIGAGAGLGVPGTGPEGVDAVWRSPEMMLALTLISAVGLSLIMVALVPGPDDGAGSDESPADGVRGSREDRAATASAGRSGARPAGAPYEVGVACGLSPRAARRGAGPRARGGA